VELPRGEANDIGKHDGRAGKELGNWIGRKVRLGHVVVVLFVDEIIFERACSGTLAILCSLLHELLMHGFGKERPDDSVSTIKQCFLPASDGPVIDYEQHRDRGKDTNNNGSVHNMLVGRELQLEASWKDGF